MARELHAHKSHVKCLRRTFLSSPADVNEWGMNRPESHSFSFNFETINLTFKSMYVRCPCRIRQTASTNPNLWNSVHFARTSHTRRHTHTHAHSTTQLVSFYVFRSLSNCQRTEPTMEIKAENNVFVFAHKLIRNIVRVAHPHPFHFGSRLLRLVFVWFRVVSITLSSSFVAGGDAVVAAICHQSWKGSQLTMSRRSVIRSVNEVHAAERCSVYALRPAERPTKWEREIEREKKRSNGDKKKRMWVWPGTPKLNRNLFRYTRVCESVLCCSVSWVE